MWPNPQFPADLVTFTKKILQGKLHFLCSVLAYYSEYYVSEVHRKLDELLMKKTKKIQYCKNKYMKVQTFEQMFESQDPTKCIPENIKATLWWM